jgi:hypothetical protein
VLPLKEGVGLAEGMEERLPVANGGVKVMFEEALGVADGTFVVLTNGSVTGMVILAEALGMVTDTTVMLDDSVKLPPVGGITIVSVTDVLEVTLLDGPGTLADGGGAPVVAGIDTFAEGVV